jgi:uncharacterized protein involved in exopolysaccharide biosynthesis
VSNKESKSESGKPEEQTPPPYPYYPPPYPYYQRETGNRMLDYWKILLIYKKLFGITTAIVVALSLVIAIVITPIYRAETLLAPVSEQKTSGLAAIAGQYGGLAQLAGINVGGDSKTEQSIATLKSRELATQFIKNEQLMPILFSSKWDINKNVWIDSEERPTYWQAYQLFDSKIRFVNSDKKSGLVTLAVEWKDPRLAATWANKLVELVNEKRRKEAIEEAEKSIAYLEKQLTTTGVVEIQKAIYRLIETQAKKKMIASTQEEYAFRVIDKAVVPEEYRKPKRLFIIFTGFIISAMLNMAIMVFIKQNIIGQK